MKNESNTLFVEFKNGILYIAGERVEMDIRKVFVKDEQGKATKLGVQRLASCFKTIEDVLANGSDKEKVAAINKLEKRSKKYNIEHITKYMTFADGSVKVKMPRNCPEIAFAMAESTLKNEYSLTLPNEGFSPLLRTYTRLIKKAKKHSKTTGVYDLSEVRKFMNNLDPINRQVVYEFFEAMRLAKKYFEKRGYKIGQFIKD